MNWNTSYVVIQSYSCLLVHLCCDMQLQYASHPTWQTDSFMFLLTAMYAQVYFALCTCDFSTYLSCVHVSSGMVCTWLYYVFLGFLFTLFPFCVPGLHTCPASVSSALPSSLCLPQPISSQPALVSCHLFRVVSLAQFVFKSWFSVQSCWSLCSEKLSFALPALNLY